MHIKAQQLQIQELVKFLEHATRKDPEATTKLLEVKRLALQRREEFYDLQVERERRRSNLQTACLYVGCTMLGALFPFLYFK